MPAERGAGSDRVLLRSGCAALIAGFALAGCATRDTLVVVVPSRDGHVGGVVVHAAGREQVLDQAYAAGVAGDGSLSARTSSGGEVDRLFDDARAARPQPPVSFTLYFREGSDEFTADTGAVVDQVFAEIARRPAAEVSVVGHTDTVGMRADNDALSRQRAERVRADLVKLGIAESMIDAAGRGEREPVVTTADETREPRNRRVEISVR